MNSKNYEREKTMKLFEVLISVNMPYPIERRYSIEASSIDVAPGRAIKRFRREIRNRGKSKRIGNIKIEIKNSGIK